MAGYIQCDNSTAGRAGLSEFFSGKGQITDNFGFVGQMVSVAGTQFCLYSSKATKDNT